MNQPPRTPSIESVTARFTSQIILPEVWDTHKNEIFHLYCYKRRSLKVMRTIMRKKHLFEATEKQWKTQLSRWKFKKNLDQKDAILIDRLYQQADEKGRRIKVYLFEKEITRLDLKAYFRKSVLPKNENEVPSLLAGYELPHYLRYVELTPETGNDENFAIPSLLSSGTNSSAMHSGGIQSSPSLHPNGYKVTANTSITSSPLWIASDAGSSAANDQQPPWELLPPGELDAISPFEGSEEDHDYDMADTPVLDLQFEQRAINDSDIGASNAMGLLQPHLYPHPDKQTLEPTDYFNAAMSVTPPQTLMDYSQNEPLFCDLAATYRTIRAENPECEQLTAMNRTAHFLVNCIQACISRSQENMNEVDAAFRAAANNFELILMYDFDDCLSTLANMVAIFECYGQRSATIKILEVVQDKVKNFGLPTSGALSDSIAFMMKTQEPEYGQSTTYDIKHLTTIYDQFCDRPEGRKSKLSIVAMFNVAWAELENKNYGEARRIFLELRPITESVFGRYHLQSVMTSACLARAHLRYGEAEMALSLIEEVVIERIKKVFKTSQPYYWESRHRQASFMVSLSDKIKDQNRQSQYRDKAEVIFREVMGWRFSILGPSNPLTKRTFHALKQLLNRQGKHHEAETLDEWCYAMYQQQRQDLWAHSFVHTKN